MKFLRLRKIGVRFASAVSSVKPSYYHRVENDTFQYITVGQLLKQAAQKYADRQALVSCEEKSQLSFSEALYRVSIKETNAVSIA
jgi:hypothetical protein